MYIVRTYVYAALPVTELQEQPKYYMYKNSFVVQNRFTLDVSLYIW